MLPCNATPLVVPAFFVSHSLVCPALCTDAANEDDDDDHHDDDVVGAAVVPVQLRFKWALIELAKLRWQIHAPCSLHPSYPSSVCSTPSRAYRLLSIIGLECSHIYLCVLDATTAVATVATIIVLSSSSSCSCVYEHPHFGKFPLWPPDSSNRQLEHTHTVGRFCIFSKHSIFIIETSFWFRLSIVKYIVCVWYF